MKLRKFVIFILLAFAGVAGISAFQAQAALTGTTCTVTSVGWRDNIQCLRTICGGRMFWNCEAKANPSCGLTLSMDAIKMFQTTADAALLSGRSVQMYYDIQSGCNTVDPVIRELYLL